MVDSNKVRTGKLEENDWTKLAGAIGPLSEAEIYIDDTPGINITEIRAKCRKLKLEKNIGMVVIDYLQLIQGTNKRNGSREQEISEISRSLKILAKELDVPVIALSQLSRAAEQRPDHRPMLSDLRESGAIEQDADIVMFLYRDDYYNEDSEKKGVAEVIIAKHMCIFPFLYHFQQVFLGPFRLLLLIKYHLLFEKLILFFLHILLNFLHLLHLHLLILLPF